MTAQARREFEAAARKILRCRSPASFLALRPRRMATRPGEGNLGDDRRGAPRVRHGPHAAPATRSPCQRLRRARRSQRARLAGGQSRAAKIQAMSGDEQSSVIHGMVDNLAARLAQNGQDVEGWLRLVRAYSVLHEADKARSALDRRETQSCRRSKRPAPASTRSPANSASKDRRSR